MKTSINLKSAVAGALLATGIFIGIAAQSSAPAGTPGRYQIVAAEGNQAYVIDTVTGEVWHNIDHEFKKPKGAWKKQ